MKEGYIVWNQSNYGNEFFGVYRTWDAAFKQFKKIIRARFGKCPRGSYNDIQSWLIDNEIEDGDDSINISYFKQYEKGDC